MKIGINAGSHLLQRGGGFKAVYWHWKALKEDLGHDVTIFVRSKIHPALMPLFHGTPFRAYQPGCEREFDSFGSIDHFNNCLPLAKDNWAHIFFPVSVPPADSVRLTSNSNYTAAHIKDRWLRDAQTLYIPIEKYYRSAYKEKIIMHVSRFAEPNEWADKAHRQFIQVMRMFRSGLPDWKLMLVGAVEDGQTGYVNSLMQMASGYPVDFLFDPTDEEIVDLYARSSIYWHATGISLPMVPSAQEHMGIAPLEAQASGCVPIVYRSGGMPEVVRENQTGLLFDDIRQLGQYTVDLANQLHTWAAFQQYGLMWAKSWSDYESFVDRVKCFLGGQSIPALPNYIPQFAYHTRDVTIAVITYNSPDVLRRCLTSLKRTAGEVVIKVVNNGDPIDTSDDCFSGVEIINTGSNLGFAGGYKYIEGKIETPLVMLANDDLEFFNPNWLGMLILPLSDPTVGIVGPKLIFPDGKLQYAGGVIDWNREDIGYHRWYGMPDSANANITEQTDYTTGAAMLMRKELFHIEDYLLDGLNMEDVDICFMAKQKGYRIIYQPASCAIHYEGSTKVRFTTSEDKVKLNRKRFRERWFNV